MKNKQFIKNGGFKAKTRIIAALLAVVTAFSVLTMSAGTASAAEANAAACASNSIDLSSLIKGVTTSVVTKAIDVGTKSNPAAAILGSGVSSLFSTVFGSLFTNGESTQKEILKTVNSISKQIDANHNEEMLELKTIEGMIQNYQEEIKGEIEEYGETLIDELQMKKFNDDCWYLNDVYTTIFELISYNCIDLPEPDDKVELIDDMTYMAYKRILTKTGFDTDCEIEIQYNNILKFLDLEKENFYQLMIDKYKKTVERQGVKSFEAINDFHSIKYSIDQIQADVVMYYVAYISLLQMDYQCDNYDHNKDLSQYDELSMMAIINEINDACDKMSKINDAYVAACELIDSYTTAALTKGDTTKYMTSTPIAWSVAAIETKNNSTVTFQLLKDWVASDDGTGFASAQERLNWYGFDPQTGALELRLHSNANISIDLTKASLDGRALPKSIYAYLYDDPVRLNIITAADSPDYLQRLDGIMVDVGGSAARMLEYNYLMNGEDGSRTVVYFLRRSSFSC